MPRGQRGSRLRTWVRVKLRAALARWRRPRVWTLTEGQTGGEYLSVLCLNPDSELLYPLLRSIVRIETHTVRCEDRMFVDDPVRGP